MTTPKRKNKVLATAGENHEIAIAYLEHRRNPGCKQTFNWFGDLLELRLKELMPDGSRKGCLKNLESDLRQDAAVLLLESLLAGSPSLATAVRAAKIQKIDEEISRSTGAAIRYASLNYIEEHTREKRNHEGVVEVCENWAANQLHQTAIEQQLVEAGWQDQKLSKRDQGVVTAIMNGIPRKEVGEVFGISESGISRLMTRLAKSVAAQNKPDAGLKL